MNQNQLTEEELKRRDELKEWTDEQVVEGACKIYATLNTTQDTTVFVQGSRASIIKLLGRFIMTLGTQLNEDPIQLMSEVIGRGMFGDLLETLETLGTDCDECSDSDCKDRACKH